MCATAAMPFDWLPINAGEAGIAPDLGDRIDAAHHNGELPGLHGVVITELALAITAGNYDRPDLRPMPLTLWRDIVLPNLTVG